MFLSEWREFPSAPCLAGKKSLMTARVSMLLKSRASPDMLPNFFSFLVGLSTYQHPGTFSHKDKCVNMSQDKDKWPDRVNTVTKLRVP